MIRMTEARKINLLGQQVTLYNFNGLAYLKAVEIFRAVSYDCHNSSHLVKRLPGEHRVKVSAAHTLYPRPAWYVTMEGASLLMDELTIMPSQVGNMKVRAMKNELGAYVASRKGKKEHVEEKVRNENAKEAGPWPDERKEQREAAENGARTNPDPIQFEKRRLFYGIALSLGKINRQLNDAYIKYNPNGHLEDDRMLVSAQEGIGQAVRSIGEILGRSIFEEIIMGA